MREEAQFDSRAGRLVRKKIRVRRSELVDNALYVFRHCATSQATLEFEFSEEEGSGLGPTLEFYSCVIDALVEDTGLFQRLPDGSLMPRPFPSGDETVLIQGKTYGVLSLFKMLGALVGRAILDQRVIDLPLATLFWDLLL